VDFLSPTVAGAVAAAMNTPDLVSLSYVFSGVCFRNGIFDNSTCFPKAVDTAVVLGNIASRVLNQFIAANTTDQSVKACQDSQEDARLIQLAQKLVPTSIAIAFISVALGGAFVVTQKLPIGIGAGALSLVGGVIMLVALLQVRSAPVYKKVGGAPEDSKPLYSNGPAFTMGLIAIFLPILGGLGLIGSTVLARREAGGSSEGKSMEMTSKVETQA